MFDFGFGPVKNNGEILQMGEAYVNELVARANPVLDPCKDLMIIIPFTSRLKAANGDLIKVTVQDDLTTNVDGGSVTLNYTINNEFK